MSCFVPAEFDVILSMPAFYILFYLMQASNEYPSLSPCVLQIRFQPLKFNKTHLYASGYRVAAHRAHTGLVVARIHWRSCVCVLVWSSGVYSFACLFLRHALIREILLLINLRPWTTQYGFVVISALINYLYPDFNLKDTAFQCSTRTDCLHVVITISRCDFCQTAPSAGAHSKCQ